MKVRPIVTGLATYVPGLWEKFRGATGGTASARYCYSVWMRHLVVNVDAGMPALPRTVAELGPGDSIGIGLAALISGVERYFALDLVRYTSSPSNLRIFDELVELFEQQADIPDENEFPAVIPRLESYEFPKNILTRQHLAQALASERIRRIRAELLDAHHANTGSAITYAAPWTDDLLIYKGQVDLIISQAVLEHVDDLNGTYAAMKAWLKPNGHMSHAIDFGSHRICDDWNGHWSIPTVVWKIIRGRRAYLLNREPLSAHIRLLEENSFDLVRVIDQLDHQGIPREKLAREFADMSDEDFATRTCFIFAEKKNE